MWDPLLGVYLADFAIFVDHGGDLDAHVEIKGTNRLRGDKGDEG